MPLTLNKNGKGAETKAPEEKVVSTEVKAEVTSTPAEGASETKVYGADRKKLAFVCPLGDPSNPDITRYTKPDGTEGKKTTSTIVGYKFKALEDMKVPNCGTNAGFKDDPMNFNDIDAWIDVKAGTEFCLTPFETALLLSDERFNGGCEGGERPVSCVYQFKSPKSKTGVVATASTAAPRVALRAVTGSIKDYDIEDVLTFSTVTVGNVARKVRTIKPGFEKWAPLTVVAKRKSAGGSSTSRDPINEANKNAQMFLAYVKNRKEAANRDTSAK